MFFPGKKVFFIGIKGTGMSSLAVLLKKAGALVCGCDTHEVFLTDSVLAENEIPVFVGFSKELLDSSDFVIYSTAYQRQTCPVLEAAFENSEVFSYPEFLAKLTGLCNAYGIAGTHGKTTTASAVSFLLSKSSLSFFSIFGSVNSPVWQGSENMILECCEYQDHFLQYRLKGVLVTNIRHDHPDYFKKEEDVFTSFKELTDRILENGFLICCADDANSCRLASYAKEKRPDLSVTMYGYNADGPYRIQDGVAVQGRDFSFYYKNRALISDLVGGAILASFLLQEDLGKLLKELESFGPCAGRSEKTAQANGIVFVDDYAHHPDEIAVTIDNIRKTYPGKKLFVVFAPHTYSRTMAFLEGFASSLSNADFVLVQSVYSSARKDCGGTSQNASKLLVKKMEEKMRRHFLKATPLEVWYSDSDSKTADILAGALQEDFVCITMGAGNNRHIAQMAIERIKEKNK